MDLDLLRLRCFSLRDSCRGRSGQELRDPRRYLTKEITWRENLKAKHKNKYNEILHPRIHVLENSSVGNILLLNILCWKFGVGKLFCWISLMNKYCADFVRWIVVVLKYVVCWFRFSWSKFLCWRSSRPPLKKLVAIRQPQINPRDLKDNWSRLFQEKTTTDCTPPVNPWIHPPRNAKLDT